MCPIWLSVFFLFFCNEPELGAGIDPGMALTPLPSSIGQGNPRPSDLSRVLYCWTTAFAYTHPLVPASDFPFFMRLTLMGEKHSVNSMRNCELNETNVISYVVK